MADAMRKSVSNMLQGIERYNPENIATLEHYVDLQCRENMYDLEANLAVLKLYQFNPQYYRSSVAYQILLKALTNLPHTDFVLCKCLIGLDYQEDPTVKHVMYMADVLEMCQFERFWQECEQFEELIAPVVGFKDSIRKFVCHVINITYQTIENVTLAQLLDVDESVLSHWVAKYGWRQLDGGLVFIANQDDMIKTKNITEKIDFESVASIMAACQG